MQTTQDHLLVNGGRPLDGTIQLGGFKHVLVGAVAAAVLGQAAVTLANCPDIAEARILRKLLNRIGGNVEHTGDSMMVDPTGLHSADLDPSLYGAIHGAVYLIPGLLHRFGEVQIVAGGGCQIGDAENGKRPTSQYLDVLRRFGAAHEVSHESVTVRCDQLRGTTIDLAEYADDRSILSGPRYSGATKYAVLCGAVAVGMTRLLNPYPKLDVTELVNLLNQLGGDLQYVSENELLIAGRPHSLDAAVTYELPSDLIELATWAAVAATTGSSIQLRGKRIEDSLGGMRPELTAWERMGIGVIADDRTLTFRREQDLRPTDVVAASHGVFSDCQPFFALLATHASGTSFIDERVWSRRFRYASELGHLGCDLRVEGHTLTIHGPCPPHKAAQSVSASDLRAAAALLVAALAIPGPTLLSGASHLQRGYVDLPGSLVSLGADIRMADVGEECH